jgi:hypothetical protein
MVTHERLVELKYVYLTIVQIDSVRPSEKQELKDDVDRLSDDINKHFIGLFSKEINDFNIADFERREQEYLKNIKRGVDSILKKATRISPVKIDYKKQPLSESDIDAKILESSIYDAPALEKNRLDGLGRFQRYLLEHVYTEETRSQSKPQINAVEKELLAMKIQVFMDRLKNSESLNLDILYKMKSKFESLLSGGIKIKVSGPEILDRDTDLIPEQVYITFDELYNVRLQYQTDTTILNLVIELAKDISTTGIRYGGRIYGTTTVAGNIAEVLLVDPNPDPSPQGLEKYRRKYQEFLDFAELRSLYTFCLASIDSMKQKEEQNQMRMKSEMRNRVSSALDDLL